MSLLVMERSPLNPPLQVVGESVDIGVYAGDRLVGSGVLRDGVCGIAVWGDDPTTAEVDGALDKQALTLKMLVDSELIDLDTEILSGELVYETDALAVVEISTDAVIPTDFAITSAYPNPFNSVMRIGYALPEAADVRLSVYDVTGRLVTELVRGRMQIGMHTAVLDGADLASGVYLIRLDAAGKTSQIKVALVK